MPPPSLLRLLLLLVLGSGAAKLVLYDNTRPVFDTEGRILDAHDGTIQRFHDDGPYYMHAVEYGLCQVCALGVGEGGRRPNSGKRERQRLGGGRGISSHPSPITA
jgi:hypothetical protein